MWGKSKERKFKRQSQRYLPCLPLGEQNFLVRTKKYMDVFFVLKSLFPSGSVPEILGCLPD